MHRFDEVDDPRSRHARRHSLPAILCLAVCAGVGGAHTIAALARLGRAHQAWFDTWLDLLHGLPSQYTFRRVLGGCGPRSRAACCARWVPDMQGQLPGAAVAVAGKQLRGSHDRSAELPALHMVSAWATA